MNDRDFVTSLSRGLNILESFTADWPRLTLQELSQRTNLPRTTVFRLLKTLMALEYVRYDDKRKEYYLGTRVMKLGFTVLNGMNLKDVAHPYLEIFADKTGENVNLGVLDGTQIIYIDQVSAREQRSFINTCFQSISPVSLGSYINLHMTAIGHATLAFMAPDDQKEILDRLFSDETIANELENDREGFLNKVNAARSKGFALVTDSFIPGYRSIGAPILDKSGFAIAAIDAAVFDKKITKAKLSGQYAKLLTLTAKNISENIGFTGVYPAA